MHHDSEFPISLTSIHYFSLNFSQGVSNKESLILQSICTCLLIQSHYTPRFLEPTMQYLLQCTALSLNPLSLLLYSHITWKQHLFCVCVARVSSRYPCSHWSTPVRSDGPRGRRHGKSIASHDITTKVLVK